MYMILTVTFQLLCFCHGNNVTNVSQKWESHIKFHNSNDLHRPSKKASSKTMITTSKKTYSKKTISGSKMATATSLKRKDQPSEGGQKSKKKSRMVEELTQDELLVLGKEVSHLLQPLNDQLEGVIKAFPQYQNEEWYQELETRQ